jgi:IclR family transcriptional regulator, KDG regulon repressor
VLGNVVADGLDLRRQSDRHLSASRDTAVGKALHGYQSDDMIYAWASTHERLRHTSNTIATVDGLLDELLRIRARGYSIDYEERELGVRCIGAPVFDRDGHAIAAISLGAPTGRLPRNLEGSQLAIQVPAIGLAISRELGYVRRARQESENRGTGA